MQYMTPEALLRKTMEQIQSASQRSDVTEIERLSIIAKRAKEIDLHFKSLNAELAELFSALERPGDTSQLLEDRGHRFQQPFIAGRKGELEAVLDWAACGITRPRAIVCEPKASETLVAFIAELVAAKGPGVLDALAQLRVNRGPLVSSNPDVDYRNSKSGQPYQHQAIPGTRFHVLTHSSTDEKLDIIRTAWRALGLPPGGLSVRRAA